MAALLCTDCTARYAVGAPCCPQCSSTDAREEGEPMPKITVHGGPTIAGADQPDPPEAESAPVSTDEEEVSSSPGTSSSPSATTQRTSAETSGSSPRKRARAAESRSKAGREESSTADGTDGSTRETPSAD